MPAEKHYKLSVLDLSPVPSGSTSSDALRNTLDLAQLADRLGYTRYWLAEHHNTPLIASSAPEIMIGHVAVGPQHIRVGSGGIMLPNHTPLKVAETFRVLEALHPGRVDLGLGRAPGTDPLTALWRCAARREALDADDFPARLDELLAFLITASRRIIPSTNSRHARRRSHARNLAARLERFLRRCSRRKSDSLSPSRITFSPSRPFRLCVSTARISPVRISQEAGIADRRLDHLRGNRRARQGNSRVRSNSLFCASAPDEWRRFPSIEEAKDYPYSPEDRSDYRNESRPLLAGSPATVREHITSLADQTARLRNHGHHDDSRSSRPPPLLRIARRSLLTAGAQK